MKIFGGYRQLQAYNTDEPLDFVTKVIGLPVLPEDEILTTYQRLKDGLSPLVCEFLQPNLDSFDTWRNEEENFTSVRGFIKLLMNNAHLQNQTLFNVLGEQPSLWSFLSKFICLELEILSQGQKHYNLEKNISLYFVKLKSYK